MSRVEKIESEVEALRPEELARFRDWFFEHDWAAWDRQIERDAADGKLDALADEALRDHTSGGTSEL